MKEVDIEVYSKGTVGGQGVYIDDMTDKGK